MANAKQLRQYSADIQLFGGALTSLLSLMEREPSFNGDGRWWPRPGNEAQAESRVRDVDRLAGRAANAFAEAGSIIEWKPRGVPPGITKPVNPAIAWRTIIDVDPMFPPSVILACCDQAIDILDMKAERAQEREGTIGAKVDGALNAWQRVRGGRGEPGRYGPIVLTAVLSVIGALFTAWVTYKLGWIGDK